MEDQRPESEIEAQRETIREVLVIIENAYQEMYAQMRMLNDQLKQIHPSMWLGILSNSTVLMVNFYTVMIMTIGEEEDVEELFTLLNDHFKKLYAKRQAQAAARGEADVDDGWLTVLPDDFIQ